MRGYTNVEPAPLSVRVDEVEWKNPGRKYPVRPLAAATITMLMINMVLLIPPLLTIAPGVDDITNRGVRASYWVISHLTDYTERARRYIDHNR